MRQRVDRPCDEDHDNEQPRNDDRPIVARQSQTCREGAHRNSSSVFLMRRTLSAPMLTAARRMIPSKSGCSNGAISKIRKKNEMMRKISAPKIEPIALPAP